MFLCSNHWLFILLFFKTMLEVNFSVGGEIFTLKCKEGEIETIQKLADELNKNVNKRSLEYPTLSQKNLMFVTALKMTSQIKSLQSSVEKYKQITSEANTDNKKSDQESEKESKLLDIINSIEKKIIEIEQKVSMISFSN